MTENLMDGLMDELNRNRELLKIYQEIGPAGRLGAMLIDRDIKAGEQAIRDNDVVAMLRAYNALKDNKG